MPRGCRLPRRALELAIAGMIGAFAVLLLERTIVEANPEILVAAVRDRASRVGAAARPTTKLVRELLKP